jgi:hypothetical protein
VEGRCFFDDGKGRKFLLGANRIIGNMLRLLCRIVVGTDDLPSRAYHGHAVATTLYL